MEKRGLPVLAFLLVASIPCSSRALIRLNAANVGTGPCCLDRAGETYVLTEDIETPGSAFVFAAPNVTLDLDHHSVVFGTRPGKYRYGVVVPPHYPHVAAPWSHSDITTWARCDGATVMNGTIVQGGGDADSCAALQAYGQSTIVVHDVVVGVSGDNTFAMRIEECSDLTIYANTITDSTEVISNRHQGRAAIDVMNAHDGPIEIFGNEIHNCRQWGIRVSRRAPVTVWGRIYNNEIYPNTIVTNGYGIGVHGDKLEVYNNTIRASNGRGIHIAGCDSAEVHGNDVDVVNPPVWDEYPRVSAHGIKLEYPTNADVYANTVVSRGLVDDLLAISNGSALNIAVNAGSNNRVHDNTFTARHMGGAAFNPADYSQFASAIEITGVAEGSGLRIEDNTFMTNDRFFSSMEWRGPAEPIDAGDILIRGNRWLRDKGRASVRKQDLFVMNSCFVGLRFIDDSGEADFRNYGTGWPWLTCSWSVAHSGSVRTLQPDGQPAAHTEVEVRDGSGELVRAATSDSQGRVQLVLDQFTVLCSGQGSEEVRLVRTWGPYRVTAAFPEGAVSAGLVAGKRGFERVLRGRPE